MALGSGTLKLCIRVVYIIIDYVVSGTDKSSYIPGFHFLELMGVDFHPAPCLLGVTVITECEFHPVSYAMSQIAYSLLSDVCGFHLDHCHMDVGFILLFLSRSLSKNCGLYPDHCPGIVNFIQVIVQRLWILPRSLSNCCGFYEDRCLTTVDFIQIIVQQLWTLSRSLSNGCGFCRDHCLTAVDFMKIVV